jgi:RHS repeat-associated protein
MTPLRQRIVTFTGKERDAETGSDYFGFRYYSSAQGRWTSPDHPFADQHPENPQSWNVCSEQSTPIHRSKWIICIR